MLVIAQQGALVSNLAFANQAANTDLAGRAQNTRQQGMDQLRLSILANAVRGVQAQTPTEARAAVTALTDNETARTIADLRAAVQAFSGKRPVR